jgi:hypothetical protein
VSERSSDASRETTSAGVFARIRVGNQEFGREKRREKKNVRVIAS